ncbi:MAG: 50S ribosomal protein L33 [Patescibacteria group bacterium]
MAKKGARELVAMICSVCKNQNYITERNKINMETKGKKGSKLEINKWCKHCRKVQLHKETSKLK